MQGVVGLQRDRCCVNVPSINMSAPPKLSLENPSQVDELASPYSFVSDSATSSPRDLAAPYDFVAEFPAKLEEPKQRLPPGWETKKTEDGRIYYVNKNLRKLSQDAPCMDTDVPLVVEADTTFNTDDFRLARDLIKEVSDLIKKINQTAKTAANEDANFLLHLGGQVLPASDDKEVNGEVLMQKLVTLTDGLRVLKLKASTSINNGVSLDNQDGLRLEVIREIADAIAEADGQFPADIIWGKQGVMRNTSDNSKSSTGLLNILSAGSVPFLNCDASVETTILRSLQFGDKEETENAAQAVLDICTNSAGCMAKLSVAGGPQMLMNALTRCRTNGEEWNDVSLKVGKAIAVCVILEPDNSLLFKNSKEILNALSEMLKLGFCCSRASRTRSNSLSSSNQLGVGKASLSRSSSGTGTNCDPENTNDVQKELQLFASKALARLCDVLGKEWSKMDQNSPILPPGSKPSISPSVVRTSSAGGMYGGFHMFISNGNERNGRGRSSSAVGRERDAVAQSAAEALEVIPKIITMICDGDDLDEQDSSEFSQQQSFSLHISPLSSPRTVFNPIEQDGMTIDPMQIFCCEAVAHLASVPICLSALVEGGQALNMISKWMNMCTSSMRAKTLSEKYRISAKDPALLLAEHASNALVKMLGAVSGNKSVGPSWAEQPQFLNILDRKIVIEGVLDSIVQFIYGSCTMQYFDALEQPTENYGRLRRSLALILHQLSSRHHRAEMVEMGTPRAFVSIFLDAVRSCKMASDTVNMSTNNLEYLDYISSTCLDGLTYFLTDACTTENTEVKNAPDLVQLLTSEKFVEGLVYVLSNLSQCKARLAALHVVSNLTEWSASLKALCDGDVVQPLVLVATQALLFQELDKKPSPSKLKLYNSEGKNNSSQRLSISKTINVTGVGSVNNVEKPLYDLASSIFGFSAEADADSSMRAAKDELLSSNSLHRDGENSSVSKGIYFSSANCVEETIIVCVSLANIANADLEYAALLYKSGLLDIMLQISRSHHAEAGRQALRCVSAICKVVPSKRYSSLKPRENIGFLFAGDNDLQIEASRIRRTLSGSMKFEAHFALDAMNTLSAALNSDNSMLQNQAIWGIAGLAMNEDEGMVDLIFKGPLQTICMLMNREKDLVDAAEAVLKNCGFSGGKGDLELCTNDFSKLKDWFVMKRWLQAQQVSYDAVDKWLSDLFHPANNSITTNVADSSGTLLLSDDLDAQVQVSSPTGRSSPTASADEFQHMTPTARSTSSSPLSHHNSLTESDSGELPMAKTPQFQLQKTLSTGMDFLMRTADIKTGRSETTPWARNEKLRRNVANVDPVNLNVDPSEPPADAMALQSLFFPSKIHRLFLLDLLVLGCEEETVNRENFHWDSDSSTGSNHRRSKPKTFFVPKKHEVYALGLPAQTYHEVLMPSLAKVIERTITSIIGAEASGRLFALAFANSTIESDFIVPFLAFLGHTPQISALSFHDSQDRLAILPLSPFQASPREKHNGYYYYLGSHVPSSIRFLTFQACLTSFDVMKLCGHLQKENAAFRGLRQNLYTRTTRSQDGYDSDASSASHGSFHGAKRPYSTASDVKRRWMYVKGLIGLSITGVRAITDGAVGSICSLLSETFQYNSRLGSLSANGSPSSAKSTEGGSEESADDIDDNDDDVYDDDDNLRRRGLKYLDVSDNNLSDSHCAQVLESACAGPLEGLDLSGNGSQKAEALTSSFVFIMTHKNDMTHNHIRHLGLRNMALPVACVCQILESLKGNITLTSLDLSANNLRDQDELNEKFPSFLNKNRALRSLDLSNNGFDVVTTSMIEVGILKNNTLLLLPYHGNSEDALCSYEFKGIQEQLMVNRKTYSRAHSMHTQNQDERQLSKAKRGSFGGERTNNNMTPRPIDISSSSFENRNAEDTNSSEALIFDTSSNSVPLRDTTGDSLDEGSSKAIIQVDASAEQKGATSGNDNISSKGAILRSIGPIDSQWPVMNNDHIRDPLPINGAPLQVPSMAGAKYNASRFTSQSGSQSGSNTYSGLTSEKPTTSSETEKEHVLAPVISRQNSISSRKNNTLHVLFAAPLALRDRWGNLHPAGKLLPYKKESAEIKQVFEDVSRDISVKFDFATSESIRYALTFGCRALHFSGHGHPNAVWLEDGCAGLQLMNKDTLLQLLRAGDDHRNIEFVFLAACYSEALAAAWVELGVKHVVCVQIYAKIQDSAAVIFTKHFYRALLSGKTVENSFNIGRQAVKSSPYVNEADTESKKFILLPEDAPHNDVIFNRKTVNEWPSVPSHCIYGAAEHSSTVLTSPGSTHIPQPPIIFEGRQVDMYRVIFQISRNRIITLTGDLGVGKSALAYAACTYMADRRMPWLQDGIVLLKEKGIHSYISFLVALCNQLKQSKSLSPALKDRLEDVSFDLLHDVSGNENDLGTFSSSPNGSGKFGGAEQRNSGNFKEALAVEHQNRVSQLLLNLLKGDSRILLVIDEIDLLLESDNDNLMFVSFLRMLFQDCPNLKVLIICLNTSKLQRLGVRVGVRWDCTDIKGLDLQNSLRLFTRLSPALNTGQDKEKFSAEILSSQSDQKDLTIQSRGVTSRTVKLFKALGDGHPQSLMHIALGSSTTQLKELKEIANESI